jgi:hypothetical protein
VALAGHRGQEERSVWAGHDQWQLHGRHEAASGLLLRRVGDGYNRAAPEVTVAVRPEALEAAVLVARQDLARLGERLSALIAPRAGAANAAAIAARMVGLDGLEPDQPR